jgi:hypothetical protein
MSKPLDEYCNNVNFDPRLVGFETLLFPFLAQLSSGRVDMAAHHLNQCLVLDGGEHPKIFSGYEHIVGKYEYSTSDRDQDVEILDVIPKYRTVSGIYQIKDNPTLYLVYLGLNDKKIHYCQVDKYTKGTDGYGYYNTQYNQHLLRPGTYLDKETKLTSSPIHDGAKYGLGVNANVACITLQGTIEDAFIISKSLAKKMQTRAIKTMTINISPNQHPLNLYGDDSEIKFLPDIGEVIREDGILCAFRTPNEDTFISDTTDIALHTPSHLHDKIYCAPAGSMVLDINFHVNKAKVPLHLYTQVKKYTEAANVFYKRIIEVYQTYKGKYELGDEFNTLVTRCMERLGAAGIRMKGVPFKNNTKLVDKDTLIEYLQIEVTYTYPIYPGKGFKLSGRDGGKGIVCSVWEDEDMPVDDFGFRADLCIDPLATFNRMNPGQLYEEYINRVSEFVRMKINSGEVANPFEFVMGYFDTINPNYGQLARESYVSPEEQKYFVDQVIQNGIYLHIPPGLSTINTDLVRKLRDIYDVRITPVEYNLVKRDGTKKRIRTKNNVCIGSKYLYLLYKMPVPSAAGFGYVNQYKTPIRPSTESRKGSQISQTPTRFGEDEQRIEVEAVPDTSEVVRIGCLQANSPKGVDMLADTLLVHPHPSRMNRVNITNKELIETNSIMSIVHHMLSTVGIDSRNTLSDPLDESKVIEYFGEEALK